jgi:hypothetical protein
MHPQLDMDTDNEECPLLQEYSKNENKNENKKQESVWNDCKAALYSTFCMSFEEKEDEKYNVWCKNDEMYHEQIFGTKMSEEKKQEQCILYLVHGGNTRYTHLILLPENTPMSLYKLIDKERKELQKALNFSECNLTEYLPESLKKLDCSECNDLTQLPEYLPESLKKLDCSECNDLTQLPEYLPESLKKLTFSGCINQPNLSTDLETFPVIYPTKRYKPPPPRQTHTSSNDDSSTYLGLAFFFSPC